jgi:hypothetical protein
MCAAVTQRHFRRNSRHAQGVSRLPYSCGLGAIKLLLQALTDADIVTKTTEMYKKGSVEQRVRACA